ncbi:hypothetical protein B0H13DRAFT_2319750 [Mycena leptocephala]|nr:hypothetical protein B0H13DRAFT_2319750 [Mycena leptocephala]
MTGLPWTHLHSSSPVSKRLHTIPLISGRNPGDPVLAPGHMAPPLVSVSLRKLWSKLLPLRHGNRTLRCVASRSCSITLRSPSAIIECCRTVAGNPIVASALRRFEISYTPSALPPPLPAFYALIGRALAQTPNIHHLILLVPDPHYCCLALEGRLAAFLNRHRQIGYLQLGAPAEGSFFPGSVSGSQHPLVALPNFEYLLANTSACVAPLIQRASLRSDVITSCLSLLEPLPAIPPLALCHIHPLASRTISALVSRVAPVSHLCHRTNGERLRIQERVESDQIEKFIVHDPLDRFIINSHAFHNASQ